MNGQEDAIEKLNGKLEECERRKERLRRFWAGEDIGRPPVSLIPYDMSPRQIFDAQEQFKRIAPYMLRIMELPGDAVPVFWPDMGTVTLASVFGGEIIREDEGRYLWLKPRFKSLDEVATFEMPDVLSGLVKEEFDRCRRWRDATEGKWPVSPPDMQGPVNIATLLIDQTEFIIGMYEKPEMVKRLLRLCTDVIIEVVRAYEREFGEALCRITWPHVWFPSELGFTLTQDSIPTLSPSLYREFELPFVKELAEKIGGPYIHCCGEFEYALDSLAEIRNLIGIDHSYPGSRAEVILEKLGTGIVLTSHASSQGQTQFPTEDKYLEYLLDRLPEGARMWYIFAADTPEVTSSCLDILKLDGMKEAYEQACKGD